VSAKYWMVSDRNVRSDSLGGDRAGLTYWLADGLPLDQLKTWSKVSRNRFRSELIAAADAFPLIAESAEHERQKHVSIFVHGYNNDWADAVRRYGSLSDALFGGSNALGVCILFSWPSDGMKLGYYPDRADARNCAPDLAEVLNGFYDWLLDKQDEQDPQKACRAKLSLIAHSMGNYLLQHSMQAAWTRANQPLLVSLLNQLLMVAADVDNDLFGSGEVVDKGDGDAIANLTYRVTALYSGLDPVLGLSAGLKHFGKRRLGRSGLDRTRPVPDNVWDVDCSSFFPEDELNIHSAYFDHPKTQELIKLLLRGVDRRVALARMALPMNAGWWSGHA
jgi:esterase/lipase superfamily enzyme